MILVPFYDFDEAHRAENAKKMAEYQSYFVPLTGSTQDRYEPFKVPLKENPVLYLYYHLERPFLVYLAMIASTSVFGQSEWAYRLPSFLFGVATIFLIAFFAVKHKLTSQPLAVLIGITVLITSADLWLSAQYAQMDTGLTFFITLSTLSLITYIRFRKDLYLKVSGLSLALAVLCKGQPAIVLTLPVIYLVITKQLSIKQLSQFVLSFLLVILPWIVYLSIHFGLLNVLKIMTEFAYYSASINFSHQLAPIFWYVRWWWESFRPGWTIFLVIFLYQLRNQQFDVIQKTLLIFVLGSLLVFSIPPNKIWWYVLPIIPTIAFYIIYSLNKLFQNFTDKLINMTLIIIIASLPIFLKTSNTNSLIYGGLIVIICFIILNLNLKNYYKNVNANILILLMTFFPLFFFHLNFPEIIPFHWNTKPVAEYYKSLPGKNCLWVYDMPTEAALFYSNAGTIESINSQTTLHQHCDHYILTPSPSTKLPHFIKAENLLLQIGNMKLFKY